MTVLLAAILGAAWRRWFGSGRPEWVIRVDQWWRAWFGILRPEKGAPYRAAQVVIGIGVLALVAGPSWLSLACAGAAIGWMTLPIWLSRQPFVWLLDRLPWLPTFPYLKGSAEWGEFLQGACLWALAAAAAQVLP